MSLSWATLKKMEVGIWVRCVAGVIAIELVHGGDHVEQ